MTRAIVLQSTDNVATLIDNTTSGASAELSGARTGAISIVADIPYGHKCAIVALRSGDEILKYGQVIGRAIANIEVGDHVHIHNVEALRARGDR
tara:strand:+ start:17448 stop:17729 length:282 start_codon:yes stop_codon:yes gene_type:complete